MTKKHVGTINVNTIKKIVKNKFGYSNIDGLIPGIRGQRAFPTPLYKDSDPFLMLDHIGPQVVGKNFFLDGTGHDHPHRGFETLTFVFEGRMDHKDSLGNRVSICSGGVQRMNAGSGIIHGGDMASDTNTARFHEMQLWVNNPRSEKMSDPEIQNVSEVEFPLSNKGEIQLKLVTGTLNGLEGPLQTKATTQIAQVIASGEGKMTIGPFPEGNKVMVYAMEGVATIGGTSVDAFELAVLSSEGDSVEIATSEASQLLVLSGKPLQEPIAFGGPFVMNTQEEIIQAQIDFQSGAFGKID